MTKEAPTKLRWTKIKALRVWHVKSFPDGLLLGFIRGSFPGWWDCFVTVPGKRWPDRERRIASVRDFYGAKRAVEEALSADRRTQP